MAEHNSLVIHVCQGFLHQVCSLWPKKDLNIFSVQKTTRCIFTVCWWFPEVFSAKAAGRERGALCCGGHGDPDCGEEAGSVLGGGVERVVLVVLVWRVVGKQQWSGLWSVPAETEQEEQQMTVVHLHFWIRGFLNGFYIRMECYSNILLPCQKKKN